jgi:hypothetical protein
MNLHSPRKNRNIPFSICTYPCRPLPGFSILPGEYACHLDAGEALLRIVKLFKSVLIADLAVVAGEDGEEAACVNEEFLRLERVANEEGHVIVL